MFKTMTSCLNKRNHPTDENIEKVSSYVFCRWLSGSPYTIQAANQINKFSDIPMVNQFYMIRNVFAGKLGYIPYPKNNKSIEPTQVGYVAEHYKISTVKAMEYIELMDPKELQDITDMYSE